MMHHDDNDGENMETNDVEMTEAEPEDNYPSVTANSDNRMDEDEPVMETPRNGFMPHLFTADAGSSRRDLNSSQYIYAPPAQVTALPPQGPGPFPNFSVPVPNMVFTQPAFGNPAPPPTLYKSDTEATRRRALDQHQRIPALTISAMSDTSPRRSQPARSGGARTPAPHAEAHLGLLGLSASKNRSSSGSAATPMKVLRTNVNPFSPDVRQKPKVMKIHVDENTPQLLLNFETEMRLGNGSFGEVLLASNRLDGWRYAIKKIRYRNETDKQKCLNEVYLLAAMGTHPNIIRYHSSWIDEQEMSIYIQMEYCNKGSLKEYAAQQTQYFSEAELLDILRQVASGLDYLHEKKGVAHLDIKPENVLVVLDAAPAGGAPTAPTYKLADFGLIANRQARGSSDTFESSFDIEEGDSRYLPRELLEENFDHALLPRADIFALGLSVWELAVRQPLPRQGVLWKDLRDLKPLLEQTVEPDARSHLTQSAAASVSQWPLWSLPQHLSPGFRDLLICMLHPDPIRRPTARKLLEHPMLNGTPLERGELKRMVEAQQNKIVSLKRELQLASNKNKSLRRRESFSGSLTASMGASYSPPLYDSGHLPNPLGTQSAESAIYEILCQKLNGTTPTTAVDLQQLAAEIATSVQSQQQTLRSSSPLPRSNTNPALLKENASPNRAAPPRQEFAPPAACGPSRIVLRRSSQTLVASPMASATPAATVQQPHFGVTGARPTFLKRTVSDFGQM